jgi:hypothetical protein
VVRDSSIGVIEAAVALVQFPAYGVLLYRAWLREEIPHKASAVSLVHGLATLVALVVFRS